LWWTLIKGVVTFSGKDLLSVKPSVIPPKVSQTDQIVNHLNMIGKPQTMKGIQNSLQIKSEGNLHHNLQRLLGQKEILNYQCPMCETTELFQTRLTKEQISKFLTTLEKIMLKLNT